MDRVLGQHAALLKEWRQQLADLESATATAVMSATMAGLAWSMGHSIGNTSLVLAAVPLGVATYVAAVALLSPDLLRIATGTVKTMVTPSRLPEREAA
jgi:hypothetical protein